MVRLADFKPMLLSERQFDLEEPGWIYELEYDGVRVTAEFGAHAVQLRTRNGADATKWFPEITDRLAEVAGGPFVVDGEVCVLDDLGRSDPRALQQRAQHRRWYERAKPVVYCVFDLLVDRGADITTQPLLLRKAALNRLFTEPSRGIVVVEYFEEGAKRLLKGTARLLGMKGLVAKRRSSIYLPGVRSSEWIKVKLPPGKSNHG
ncbi:putative ATP-dependent DNA ligase YkoU [Variovorax sp. RA8]|nr:putative ATP-dependent DNA ligase YkoU [Variovorax sp. RA8]